MHPLHQLLSIIKNGQKNGLLVVYCTKSIFTKNILLILSEHGFIQGFRPSHSLPHNFEILLKYSGSAPVISTCSLISKPSKKLFFSFRQLKEYLLSHSSPFYPKPLFILSTNKGIVSHYTALKAGQGGLLLCSFS